MEMITRTHPTVGTMTIMTVRDALLLFPAKPVYLSFDYFWNVISSLNTVQQEFSTIEQIQWS